MASTFSGIEMGKKALITEQTAMKTAGHNVSNANTEGYSRQRVNRQTEIPLYDPSLNRDQRPGQIGQGVEVQSIERFRDHFVDSRMMDESGRQGYWKARNETLYNIELIHNEPGDRNIRSLMDQYWNGLQELANNPAEAAVREVVRERARTLSHAVNHTFRQLDTVQKNLNMAVRDRTEQFNVLVENIRQLNVQIQRSENIGDRPNDLYDRRDLLVERLSKMADITVSRRDPDEFIVYLGTVHLIQGPEAVRIEPRENPSNKGFYSLFWEGSPEPVRIGTGELGGLLELRDVELDRQLRDLNTLAANLADQINEIHRDGFDLNNNTNLDFFRTIPITENANGDFDRNNDGIPEITALFKVSGRTALDLNAEIGVQGTLTFAANRPGEPPITVDYVPQDTVRDILRKINQSQAEVTATLNHNGQITFRATTAADKSLHMDFVIRHLEDSGDFLVTVAGLLGQSGPAGAFDWQAAGQAAQIQTYDKNIALTPMYDPASWLQLSEAIVRDVRAIAAAGGTDMTGAGDATMPNGPGDGSQALRMAELRNKKTMVGMNETFNDFYTAVIARAGVLAEQAEIQNKTSDTLVGQLAALRESLSGVNLDEEMANLIMFQHAYNAAARFVTIQDRMLETIIRMGL